LRDLFKVGLWDNLAGYGSIERSKGDAQTRALADAVGVSVHALLIDEFQLDLYWGVGFRSDGPFGNGASLQIAQAF
jgi:hypothetical protein